MTEVSPTARYYAAAVGDYWYHKGGARCHGPAANSAVGETSVIILLHPPRSLVGVSIRDEEGVSAK